MSKFESQIVGAYLKFEMSSFAEGTEHLVSENQAIFKDFDTQSTSLTQADS